MKPSNMVSNIVLFASEVASVCEIHPYRNVYDTFTAVYKRIAQNNIKTKDEHIEKLIKQIDTKCDISNLINDASTANTVNDIQTLGNRIDTIVPKASKSISTKVEPVSISTEVELTKVEPVSISANVDQAEVEPVSISTKVEPVSITEDDRCAIVKSIESKINCSFGTKQESPAIEQYEKQQSASVGQRNDKFHKRKIITIDGCSIFIGGKVDGIKEDGTIIEVKNRMRRFFDPLPEYDIAQLQTYLFILNADRGELVEQLKTNTTSIKTTEINIDLNMWNMLLKPRIINFSRALIELMANTELQNEFKAGSNLKREQIINSLL